MPADRRFATIGKRAESRVGFKIFIRFMAAPGFRAKFAARKSNAKSWVDAVPIGAHIAKSKSREFDAERVGLIEAALRAGKHVLSQKPFVLDLEVGKRLAALAAERGLHLAVNQNGRWAPHFRYALQAVRAGLIGPVASVSCADGTTRLTSRRAHAGRSIPTPSV